MFATRWEPKNMSELKFAFQQRGTALVVGLLLLLVVTILAISGMNSATLEFIMAGNEQFRQNAFQIAEAGIADTLVTGSFTPSAATATRTHVYMTGGSTSDYFDTTLASELGGAPHPAIWGNAWNSFATYHFEISSTGHSSVRNAIATNVQGIAVLAPWDSSVLPGGGLGNKLCASPPCP